MTSASRLVRPRLRSSEGLRGSKPLLVGLQLDEFSASPKLIPNLQQTIRTFSLKETNCNPRSHPIYDRQGSS